MKKQRNLFPYKFTQGCMSALKDDLLPSQVLIEPQKELIMRKLSPTFIYFFGALGGLLFGYDTGVISGALLFIQTDLHVHAWAQGWITSAVLLGAVLGALIIGPMSDRLGRKKLLLLSAIIFFIGALGSGLSGSEMMLIISRIILGISVGAASALVPTYLSELAPAKQRGGISTMFQLMIMSGILLAYISNYGLQNVAGNWHWMLGLAAVPAALLFIGGLFLPESPRFLVRHNQESQARQVLNIIHGKEELVEQEIADIQLMANEEKTGGLQELFGSMSRPVLIMAMGLAIFQQVMGCNTVLYFAPTIFTSVGFGKSAALLAHVGIGIFNVIVTYIAMKVMDKVDRRWMLNFGAWGMGISLVLMSVGMMLGSSVGFAKYLAVIALTIYIAFFSATWGPVMWVMIGESFPLNIRGLGNSFGAVVNWAANFIVSLTFLPLLQFFGTGKIFLLYAAFCFLSIWFTSKKVIETRGRSLENIEAELRSRANHLLQKG